MDGGAVAHRAFAEELRAWASGVVTRQDCRQTPPDQRRPDCGRGCACPRSRSGTVWQQWDQALDRIRLAERGWLDVAKWYRADGSHKWPLRDMLEAEAALDEARREKRRMIEAMANARGGSDADRARYVQAKLAELG